MKTFIVLGMHRSATSLIAKGLHESGVHMGDHLLGAHASNPYGHFEDVEFLQFNRFLLSRADGNWRHPPTKDRIRAIGKEHRDSIKWFIEKKQREPFWGWKDPRTTLTIECYLDFLINPHFIACFRDPVEVARSLNKRDGMDIKEGIRLALVYNNRMTDFLTRWYNANSTYQSTESGISRAVV